MTRRHPFIIGTTIAATWISYLQVDSPGSFKFDSSPRLAAGGQRTRSVPPRPPFGLVGMPTPSPVRITAICHSSVSDTDSPPRRGSQASLRLAPQNSHSIGFTSYLSHPFLPDSGTLHSSMGIGYTAGYRNGAGWLVFDFHGETRSSRALTPASYLRQGPH